MTCSDIRIVPAWSSRWPSMRKGSAMAPGRLPPDRLNEWLNRVRSSLTLACESAALPDTYLEDLCFGAQQAAEKAIKAVLLHLGVGFPSVHDLSLLLTRVEQAG